MSSILDMIPWTWRGIPLQTYGYIITEASQKKVHLGTFWTGPIIEDLGKGPVHIKMNGFLDPSFDFLERPLLEAMITAPGAGLLTIPSKGIIYAHCMSASFTEDISSIIEINMEFIQVQSPLGLLGDILGGSLPSNIGDAIAGVQSDVISDLGSAVSKATSAIGGLF